MLFSEFALDLPGDLPASLADVPRADKTRRALIFSVCEHLRDARTHQRQLDLPACMADTTDFGPRDTFSFEERAFLQRCADAADKGDLKTARSYVDRRRNSIWVQAEDRGAAWVIADRGLELLQSVMDMEKELGSVPKGLAPLIGFYVDRARRADTLHRNFQRTVHDAYGQTEGLERLIESARRRHRTFSDLLQHRGGKADRITTRRPMIEIVLFQQDMFGGETLSFSLEAKAEKRVVGEVAPNANVDPATGLVTIEPGAAVKIPLRMADEFEGKFTVTAVDPVTQAIYDEISLQTDYMD